MNAISSSAKDQADHEELEEFLNERMEQLAKNLARQERTSKRTNLFVGVLIITGILLIFLSTIIFIEGQLIRSDILLFNVNSTFALSVFGGLLAVSGGFLFWQKRNDNIRVRSYYLDKVFEMQKISQALRFISIADGKTKDHLKELLILELLGNKWENSKSFSHSKAAVADAQTIKAGPVVGHSSSTPVVM